MNFDPCSECGAKWYGPHKPSCSVPAEKFLKTLGEDGTATADDNPRCPRCGAVDLNWTDRVPGTRSVDDGDRWTHSCEDCGHEYRVELIVLYRFRVRAA